MKRFRVGIAAGLMVSALALGGCTTGGGGNTPPWLAAGCIDSSIPGLPDFVFSGYPNYLYNGHSTQVGGIDSEDGTCTGDISVPGTVVQAANMPLAIAVCAELGVTVTSPAHLATNGYAVPTDAWACVDQAI